MTAARAFIRCDASPQMGAGHVMRCLAFAETLSWAGWPVTFATRRESIATVPALPASGHAIEIVGNDNEPRPGVADRIALVDHYGLDASYEKSLAEKDRAVVVFDDLADRPHACDVLLDPTPGRVPGDYAARVPAGTKLLTGARLAIVRQVWRAYRKRTCARLAAGHDVERIVVSMGATDPSDATSRVLEALRLSAVRARIDVILGAGAPHRSRVERALGPDMELHVDPADLPALVAQADFAIGAPGSSSFERATLGLPAILIPTADNQNLVAAAFGRMGAADVLPASVLNEPERLAAYIAALAKDGPRRAAMSKAAASVTDGRGAQRLLLAIAGDVRTSEGSALSLRLAEESDSYWLLDLQRKPETRRFARHPAVPTSAEHAEWFASTLANPERLLMIAESGGAPAGMVRLDRIAAAVPTFEVSIAIDPSWHRRGVGLAALSLVRKLVPGADIIATVFPQNAASVALFKSAGYVPETSDTLRSKAA